MKSAVASVFCTFVIFSGIASSPTSANLYPHAQTSQLSLRIPRAERLAEKLPSPDELFDRQKQEQEILLNRWQQQQEQRQQQQDLRFQQQIEQQQHQQFLLQQQQERQLQPFNQPK
jgi:hypothetical protein